MNFWETEEAGQFAESILENRDVICKDIHLERLSEFRRNLFLLRVETALKDAGLVDK